MVKNANMAGDCSVVSTVSSIEPHSLNPSTTSAKRKPPTTGPGMANLLKILQLLAAHAPNSNNSSIIAVQKTEMVAVW